MTKLLTAPSFYSASRPHILVPAAPEVLSADERTAMMRWLPHCTRRKVAALKESVPRVRHTAIQHVLDVFAADPQSPGRQIEDWAHAIGLVVTELVANAVENMLVEGGPITVELSSCMEARSSRIDRAAVRRPLSAVRICVEDDNPAAPAMASEPPDLDSEDGRGLYIVSRYAAYADVVPSKSAAKRVRLVAHVPELALADELARWGCA